MLELMIDRCKLIKPVRNSELNLMFHQQLDISLLSFTIVAMAADIKEGLVQYYVLMYDIRIIDCTFLNQLLLHFYLMFVEYNNTLYHKFHHMMYFVCFLAVLYIITTVSNQKPTLYSYQVIMYSVALPCVCVCHPIQYF